MSGYKGNNAEELLLMYLSVHDLVNNTNYYEIYSVISKKYSCLQASYILHMDVRSVQRYKKKIKTIYDAIAEKLKDDQQ